MILNALLETVVSNHWIGMLEWTMLVLGSLYTWETVHISALTAVIKPNGFHFYALLDSIYSIADTNV